MGKTFDKLNHDILIWKVKAHGILDPILSWFKLFISNHKQNFKNNIFVLNLLSVTFYL